MARMKKRKLCWKGSGSSQVVGYKLYWASGGGVNYQSSSAEVGNVTGVILPDEVETFAPGSGPIEFGVTAVDELGNESDMVTLMAPYQFNVPEAPADLHFETAAEKRDTPAAHGQPGARRSINLFSAEGDVRQLKSV
jgi:hypothetical protein